jgi:hypothetical protein
VYLWCTFRFRERNGILLPCVLQIPASKSIEDLFFEAQERHDAAPMEKLTEKLMEADKYLASRLASASESNCYGEFFKAFDKANFLTFNSVHTPPTLNNVANRDRSPNGYSLRDQRDLGV